MAKDNSKTKTTTGKVRFSYLNIETPRAVNEGDTEKYGVCLLIPKSDKKTVAAIKKCIKEAYEGGASVYGGKLPKIWKNPLRNGDTEREDDPAFEGHYFINANSINKPGIVDKNIQDVLESDRIWSGCFGRASVNFYAYNKKSKGVGCGLFNLQTFEYGDRLSGAFSDPEEDFGDGFVDDYEEEEFEGHDDIEDEEEDLFG